jgi:uncharacterized protein (DUF4415 family)
LLKKPIGEAREKLTSGDVLEQYVGARQLSATKHRGLFQQPAKEKMKKSRKSSARGERAERKGKDTRRKKINFSDIPERSERQLSRMRRVGRPTVGEEPRKLIAIRLDPKVLGWLRETAEKKGLPYQSLVNQILAEEMKKTS